MTTAPESPAAALVPVATLALRHARIQFLETIRVPIAVIGTAMFPAISVLFFVVPIRAIAGDPASATGATAQLSVFSMMSVCLFSFGVGVAEDRALAWDPYLRTLPAGPGPRLAGRLLNGLAFGLLGLMPLLLIAVTLTAATITPGRLLAAVGALALAATPFLGIGLGIGYSLPSKAALAVAQLLLFPLAFAGGLFIPPDSFPSWLNRVSAVLPSRAGRELVVGATTDSPVAISSLIVLVLWTVAAGALAVWAYRRDEGRRFR
jgi:ABC-2 type transport system permease protein